MSTLSELEEKLEEMQKDLRVSQEELIKQRDSIDQAEEVIKEKIAEEIRDLQELPRGVQYLYRIDAKSETELIPTIAGIANSKGAPALIISNNLPSIRQGIDFKGRFTQIVKGGKFGTSEIMQIMGRIARSHALGHRYFLIPQNDYESSQRMVIRTEREMGRAMTRAIESHISARSPR